MISHERGNDREVFTTSETYPWSFVTQIFHSGQPSHGGDRKTFGANSPVVYTNVATSQQHLQMQYIYISVDTIKNDGKQMTATIHSAIGQVI